MAYDIHGQPLEKGHCEVHPWVHAEYPCPVCYQEVEAEARQRASFNEPPTQEHYSAAEVKVIAIAWAVYCRDNEFIEAQMFDEWFEREYRN